MPENRLSQRKLSTRKIGGGIIYTYAGVIDTIGPRSRGSYIDGISNTVTAACSYVYASDCACCGNDGYPYYNCYSCDVYQMTVNLSVPSSSFSATPARGYMDNNNKGYKSFAIVSNYSSTAYSANNCTTCTGGYGSTSAWADYEGNYWYHLGDMAYAGIREADGTLWTWGYNENGLLGNNTAGFSTSTKSPVQLGSNSWKMVVGSSRQNTLGWFVAIRSDDTLWAWGYNGDGQLGDGTTTSRSSPVQVSGGGAWKYIAVGRYSTVGIKTDGTLHGWGSNGSGELGDGTTTNRSSPVQISGGGTWKKVVGGVNGSLGIKTDGTAYGWGYNGYYCLGFGTNAFRSSPVQVSGGYSDWTDVSLPYYDYWGYGIRSNGTLWGWGTYVYGLSLTYPYYYSVPVQIGSATNFASCSIDNGSVDYWSYDKPGPVFITNIGNVVNFQGYNSTQTILYSGSYAVQFIRPTGNYYANAFLMKYVP